MEFETIRSRVLNTEDLTEIYTLEIDITKHIGDLHKSYHKSQYKDEQTDARSALSNFQALLEICKDRKADVRDTGARLNYNFRMAAKTMLQKETYNSIMQKATLPRKEVKAEQKELKANRIE